MQLTACCGLHDGLHFSYERSRRLTRQRPPRNS